MQPIEIIFFFFIIALVYASVGFGGGSSYIALLAVYALPFKEIKLIALLCNIIVVAGSAIVFIKHQQIDWKKTLPLTAISVPLAYLGATIKISEKNFFILLGSSLLIAAVLLWIKIAPPTAPINNRSKAAPKTSTAKEMLLGSAVGFLSGSVGIGGGIFLSPLLHLMKWNTPSKIAATASIFILFNSLSGLAGLVNNLPPTINYTRIFVLCMAVFLGGQLGCRLGAVQFNALTIRRITSLLVFLAGIEILSKHFH